MVLGDKNYKYKDGVSYVYLSTDKQSYICTYIYVPGKC